VTTPGTSSHVRRPGERPKHTDRAEADRWKPSGVTSTLNLTEEIHSPYMQLSKRVCSATVSGSPWFTFRPEVGDAMGSPPDHIRSRSRQ
jgi:hypothetical protein